MLRTSPPEHRGVRNVYFHKGEEIIPLLISGRSSTLRVEAAPFIPKSLAAAEADGPAVDAENAQLQGDPQFNADGSSEELESASAAVEAISVAQPSVVSQEETSKAVIIQRAYRKAVRRKRGGKHSGLQATRDAFFELCASAASGIDWPDRSQYQLLFLGPVTHALVAADRIHRHAYSAKQKARKQLSKLQDHQELEDARARQTKCASSCSCFVRSRLLTNACVANELFRAALNLQKALDPKAEVHRKRDTAVSVSSLK